MNRPFFLQAAALVAASILCAFVANAFAPRERQLNLFSGPPVAAGVDRRADRGRTSMPPASVPDPQPAVTGSTQSVTAEPLKTARKPVAEANQPPGTPPPATAARDPETEPRAPAPSPRQFPPHPDKPWVEIDPASVRELYARGVPFIDARRTATYEEGHIAGARSIPVWESDLDQRLNAFYELGLDPEAPVVVYCSGGNCEDSHMLAQRLWGLGFNNVQVYKDGYPDWLEGGGATEKGREKGQ